MPVAGALLLLGMSLPWASPWMRTNSPREVPGEFEVVAFSGWKIIRDDPALIAGLENEVEFRPRPLALVVLSCAAVFVGVGLVWTGATVRARRAAVRDSGGSPTFDTAVSLSVVAAWTGVVVGGISAVYGWVTMAFAVDGPAQSGYWIVILGGTIATVATSMFTAARRPSKSGGGVVSAGPRAGTPGDPTIRGGDDGIRTHDALLAVQPRRCPFSQVSVRRPRSEGRPCAAG